MRDYFTAEVSTDAAHERLIFLVRRKRVPDAAEASIDVRFGGARRMGGVGLGSHDPLVDQAVENLIIGL